MMWPGRSNPNLCFLQFHRRWKIGPSLFKDLDSRKLYFCLYLSIQRIWECLSWITIKKSSSFCSFSIYLFHLFVSGSVLSVRAEKGSGQTGSTSFIAPFTFYHYYLKSFSDIICFTSSKVIIHCVFSYSTQSSSVSLSLILFHFSTKFCNRIVNLYMSDPRRNEFLFSFIFERIDIIFFIKYNTELARFYPNEIHI